MQHQLHIRDQIQNLGTLTTQFKLRGRVGKTFALPSGLQQCQYTVFELATQVTSFKKKCGRSFLVVTISMQRASEISIYIRGTKKVTDYWCQCHNRNCIAPITCKLSINTILHKCGENCRKMFGEKFESNEFFSSNLSRKQNRNVHTFKSLPIGTVKQQRVACYSTSTRIFQTILLGMNKNYNIEIVEVK